MSKPRNNHPKGFLDKYRTRQDKDLVFLPMTSGWLKLEYGLGDNRELLSLVSFVLEKSVNAPVIGLRLELTLTADKCNEVVTFISENGVSGDQWEAGRVIWGHTYDDDSAPTQGRKKSLDKWIDECIEATINPDKEE